MNDNGSRNPFADTRNVRNANTPTTGSGPTSNDVTLVSIPHTESTSAPTDRAKPAAG